MSGGADPHASGGGSHGKSGKGVGSTIVPIAAAIFCIVVVIGFIASWLGIQTGGGSGPGYGGGQNVATQTTTIPAQPSSAAPAGCRGPEPTIRMQPGQEYVLPEFCRFDFNVVGGTITLQGTDGATIDVARGQTVHFPTGFHPTRMWSAMGAEVQASFFRM